MLDKAKKILKDADAILVSAGAGMGVDSGLPDFRGVEGFWNAYPIIKKLGYRFEEMANPRWFREDPTLAWAFYGHRLNLYRETTPHVGFGELLNFVKDKKGGYFVFTSNVDGQFQKAGFDSKNIVEVHGSIHHLQCSQPCTKKISSAKNLNIDIDNMTFRTTSSLPKCSHCGAIMRPNILMFGDWNWIGDRSDAQNERFQLWLNDIRMNKYKLVVIEFGAGHKIPTIRMLSEEISREYNASLIRINPRDYDIPYGKIGLNFGAKEAIEKILV